MSINWHLSATTSGSREQVAGRLESAYLSGDLLRDAIRLFVLLVCVGCLSGCIGTIWTGATLMYDRHGLYATIRDYKLAIRARHLVYQGGAFKEKGCFIDITVFNQDVLLSGHVPQETFKQLLRQRIAQLTQYRHIYDEVTIGPADDRSMQDLLMTTSLNAQIISDSSIDPHAFKVVTTDGIVYLMGEVRADQARRVIQIAQEKQGVLKVVSLLQYYERVKPDATPWRHNE